MSIGEELRRYRLNALLTQKHLGELLGLKGNNAKVTVQRWEWNRSGIATKHMRKLHNLIGIPYEAMLPEDTDNASHSIQPEDHTV